GSEANGYQCNRREGTRKVIGEERLSPADQTCRDNEQIRFDPTLPSIGSLPRHTQGEKEGATGSGDEAGKDGHRQLTRLRPKPESRWTLPAASATMRGMSSALDKEMAT